MCTLFINKSHLVFLKEYWETKTVTSLCYTSCINWSIQDCRKQLGF